ncbi:Pleckstrin homology domain-containing family M member 1 [Bagarius yarrelli]|uniref:Pleckstrin homology domain-containing family M member 1 n=1 Tax=Bagarius yarrelli TaxID=175774 RepID=A0A556TIG2_BAGYA|nr:Pleckstrin homology domain-containing family M member 1 [Bagarius yarrelli]
MLATQLTDSVPEAKNVKQWIKERIAQTLKTLQKRYVTTDAPVTSEDFEANQLCCALEAVFIHGLRSKHIRTDGSGARNRKGGSLPQPVFWNLLKAITHRHVMDVILELEGLSFINSDVGRCRAWVRLALNDGLLECYLTSLLRESTKLGAHYQSGALLLDPEEREVLLSLLQGLASLAFQLSYKSAVLNEWTTTPLALAGLCPLLPMEDMCPPSSRRESWDTASQSSGSGGSGKGQEDRTPSDLSLDTAGSCQLSSSFGSGKESWSCHVENKSGLDEMSTSSSQDIVKELDVLSPAADSMIESSIHSSSDEDLSNKQDVNESSNNQDRNQILKPFINSSVPHEHLVISEEELSGPELKEPVTAHVNVRPKDNESCIVEDAKQNKDYPDISFNTSKPVLTCQMASDSSAPSTLLPLIANNVEQKKNTENASFSHSSNASSRKSSEGSVSSHHKSMSWISDEDIFKPDTDANGDCKDDVLESTKINRMESAVAKHESHQFPPRVVHRRQIGLSNPFRGLLKLGQLERRGTMGLWRVCHCELSPFGLLIYADGEERNISDNHSLLRCEDVRMGSVGRFYLKFPGKRLQLRAPSKAEAEDWVERILEAVNKLRHQPQEDWDDLSPCIMPVFIPPEPSNLPETDWNRPCEAESDAIKEAVVLLSREPQGWSEMVLSLSLETLQAFSVQNGCKTRLFTHSIDAVRDVVPAVALGGPAFFKVLTAKETLMVQAESGEEAHAWRSLIRRALDSYLEENETGAEMTSMSGGNIQRLVQHRLRGDAVLLPYLTAVPKEKGLNAQNFKCAGDLTIIPSRMVHNWDLTTREVNAVSRQALKLLTDIEQEPLLDLNLLNPDLFDHSETMATVAAENVLIGIKCKACKTVLHSSCKAQSVACPRCERLQRYKERDLLE